MGRSICSMGTSIIGRATRPRVAGETGVLDRVVDPVHRLQAGQEFVDERLDCPRGDQRGMNDAEPRRR